MVYTDDSKDTRTEADLFRTGFFDLEDTPKYAFTEKADDKVKYDLFNLLDYKTPQSRMNALSKIREEKAIRNEGVKLHAAYKPEDKKVELDPNIRIIPTPKADFTLEWRAANPALKWEAGNAMVDADEGNNARDQILDVADRFKKSYDYAKIHKGLINGMENAGKEAGRTNYAAARTARGARRATIVRKHSYAATVRKAQKAAGNPRLSAIPKTGGKGLGVCSKAIDIAIEVYKYDADKKAYISQGMNPEEAQGRSLYNTVGRIGFSMSVSAGLPATCAFIGSFFGPAGAVIGGFIGHLGAWALDYAYSDDVGDFVEAQKYDTHQNPEMIYG